MHGTRMTSDTKGYLGTYSTEINRYQRPKHQKDTHWQRLILSDAYVEFHPTIHFRLIEPLYAMRVAMKGIENFIYYLVSNWF